MQSQTTANGSLEQQNSAYVAQVGGNHYKATVQHWDLMDKYNVSYLEASASKYLVRWESKGGIQDLEKAISYIRKRLAEISNPATDQDFLRSHRRFTIPTIALFDWMNEQNLGKAERNAVTLILAWDKEQHLLQALDLIQEMITNQKAVEAAYTHQG